MKAGSEYEAQLWQGREGRSEPERGHGTVPGRGGCPVCGAVLGYFVGVAVCGGVTAHRFRLVPGVGGDGLFVLGAFRNLYPTVTAATVPRPTQRRHLHQHEREGGWW